MAHVRRLLLAAVLASAGISVVSTAAYCAFPDRPIRWILSHPPGGSADVIALAVNPVRTLASIVHLLVCVAPPSLADGADPLVEIADDAGSIGFVHWRIRVRRGGARGRNHLRGACAEA